jgi:hypothetical protein
MLRRTFNLALIATILLAAGCGGSYSRGQFQGFVMGATEEEIVSKVGKPDEIDAKDPNRPRWIYVKKTFDPDNLNQVDAKVTVTLERDAKGKLVGKDVLFG